MSVYSNVLLWLLWIVAAHAKRILSAHRFRNNPAALNREPEADINPRQISSAQRQRLFGHSAHTFAEILRYSKSARNLIYNDGFPLFVELARLCVFAVDFCDINIKMKDWRIS